MPKNLGGLFRSTIKTTSKTSSTVTSPASDVALNHFVSSLETSSPSTSTTSKTILKRTKLPKQSTPKPATDFALTSLKFDTAPCSDDSTKQLSREISSIFCGGTDLNSHSPGLQGTNDGGSLEKVLEIPWFSNMSNNNTSMRRKEVSRERKQKWTFKNTQGRRCLRLVKMCAEKLGTDATIEVFGKLGRETGVKEYNALIGLCIEEARKCDDEDDSLQQISKAYKLINLMKEQGYKLEEETYGPFLVFFIDMGMVEEFQHFYGVLENENPSTISRLGYYEMLLWIQVNNEEKIQELCRCIAVDDGKDESNFQENYLLALCESNRTKELLQMLEIIDITKISSVDYVTSIFKFLGKLSLESFAKKFLLACKTCDHGTVNVSHFIAHYVISMPNIVVEDVISKFKDLHAKLEVTPSSVSYEKLIIYCCDSLKVHAALDVVDQMYELGLTLSIDTFHSIIYASDESFEFTLVRRIYSLVSRHKLIPNHETFRSMMNLSVRMKDFDGAYGMLSDLRKMNLMPTASMYNAIMVGYYREKNINGALLVLKQMELADVKPDSQTFSYLIGNCDTEEDIVKYSEEMDRAGIPVTKHILMALINAYTACGQFEKAKQVVLDKGVPMKCLNEIKSVLVQALASHGQICDALNTFEEIKHGGCNLEPKAVINLIEHLQSEGELTRLIQLLKELNDSHYWGDGCTRVILYCVRFKHLSCAVALLKQFKDKFCYDELAIEILCNEVFSQIAETEPIDVQFGIDFLRAIKEVGFRPSRRSLDFLLGACVNAKDLKNSYLVWKEYQITGLPYNVLSFLRMYQALLVCGDHKAATKLLKKIPRFDSDVRSIIRACQSVYVDPTSAKGKKKGGSPKKNQL